MDFRTCVLHGTRGARISLPVTWMGPQEQGNSCPRVKLVYYGTEIHARIIYVLCGAWISVAPYYMVRMGYGDPCPRIIMVRMGHGNPCPRLKWIHRGTEICVIWSTDFRGRLLYGKYGAWKSVPRLYALYGAWLSMPASYMVHMGHRYPCWWCKWVYRGTKIRARVLHGTYGARISMPAT